MTPSLFTTPAGRERLILDHIGLPRVVARTLTAWANAHDLDEMISDGNVGLVKAADTFKHDRRFDVFAYGRIRAEIIEGLRARTHVRNARQITWVSISTEHEDGTPFDWNIPDDKPTAEERRLADDARHDIADAVARSPLDPREQAIVGLYYWQDLGLREIGELLGVSASRVCQIHKAALAKLAGTLAAAAA